MKLSEIGEFGLINLVRERAARQPRSEAIILGIGDDAAAWRVGSELLLGTTDTLVEGVHFLPGPGDDLGWKAMAASLSDIAAMGGRPQVALVSLALPPSTEVAWVEALYEGILAAAGEYGVALAGGDTVASPVPVLTVALLGRSHESGQILRRSAARPGDLLAVTGYLGSAEGGLRVLKGTAHPPEEAASFLLEAHMRPRPRVSEGQTLVSLGVQAAIDISDGLLADAAHLCRESGVAATIEAARLPVHRHLRESFPDEYVSMAASVGEDYELLFAAPAPLIEQAARLLSTPVTVIGKVETGPPGQVVLLGDDGTPLRLAEGGWQHFREKR